MTTDAAWLTDRTPIEAATLNRLQSRLARDAEADGSLDIAYRTLETPVGLLLLAATENGLLRIGFDTEGHDQILQALAGRVSPRILLAPARLEAAARQLEEYFAGRRRRFDLPLDLRLAAGFRRQVLAQLPQIPYGQTESYQQVALATGRPTAVRAVGSACATNPLPVVIPCHRVLRSDGALGGYLGGLDVKRRLLSLEAA